MRPRLIILIAAMLCTAAFFFDEIASFFENVQLYAEGGNKEIFEINLSSEQLMNQKRARLLKDSSHSYHKSSLKLAPYFLFEAKYVDEKEKSKEGWILWSAVDGEIVLDTESWQTTHGYQDALLSDAGQEDFDLIRALIKRNGSANKEQLLKDLKLEEERLDKILKSASKKNLAVLFNDTVKLHVENPKIMNFPSTRIKHPLVLRETDFDSIIPKRFASRKVEKAAKASFGKEFTIRGIKEVFLPIWKLEVKKPDDSLSISYWNAVNGEEIDSRKL